MTRSPATPTHMHTISLRHTITGVFISLAASALFVADVHAQRSASPAAPKQFVSPHFTINYSDVDSGTIAKLAAGIERERARIVEDLAGSAAPMITIEMYASRD